MNLLSYKSLAHTYIHTYITIDDNIRFSISPFLGPTSLYRVTVIYIFVGSHHSGYREKIYIHIHTHIRKQRCDTVSSGGGVVDITSSSDNKPTLLFCFNSLEKSTATSTLTHWYILLLTYRPSIKKNTEIPAYVLYIRRTLYTLTQTRAQTVARKNRRGGRSVGGKWK